MICILFASLFLSFRHSLRVSFSLAFRESSVPLRQKEIKILATGRLFLARKADFCGGGAPPREMSQLYAQKRTHERPHLGTTGIFTHQGTQKDSSNNHLNFTKSSDILLKNRMFLQRVITANLTVRSAINNSSNESWEVHLSYDTIFWIMVQSWTNFISN